MSPFFKFCFVLFFVFPLVIGGEGGGERKA